MIVFGNRLNYRQSSPQPTVSHGADRARAHRPLPESSRPRPWIGTQISQMNTDSKEREEISGLLITGPAGPHICENLWNLCTKTDLSHRE